MNLRGAYAESASISVVEYVCFCRFNIRVSQRHLIFLSSVFLLSSTSFALMGLKLESESSTAYRFVHKNDCSIYGIEINPKCDVEKGVKVASGVLVLKQTPQPCPEMGLAFIQLPKSSIPCEAKLLRLFENSKNKKVMLFELKR